MDRKIVWPKQGITPCPACAQGTRIIRVNRTTGALFEGCSRYPSCRWTLKTRYGLDYAGHSCPIRLDSAKCARILYGVELSDLRTGEPITQTTKPRPLESYTPAREWDVDREDDDEGSEFPKEGEQDEAPTE